MAHAWANRIAETQRVGDFPDRVCSVGFDAHDRLLEMVAAIGNDDVPLV